MASLVLVGCSRRVQIRPEVTRQCLVWVVKMVCGRPSVAEVMGNAATSPDRAI